jgi:hypothetical protein
MNITSLRYLAITAFCFTALSGCKPRDEYASRTLDNSLFTVTDKVKNDENIKLNTKGKQQNYVQIDVEKAGILNVNVTFSPKPVAAFKTPVKIAIYDQPNQTTPIAIGDVAPDANNPWRDANANIEVLKPGPIFVSIVHLDQFGAGSNVSLYTSLTAIDSNPNPVVNYPGNFETLQKLNGDALRLGLAASRTLASVSAYVSFYMIDGKVSTDGGQGNANCVGCKMTMILTDNGKDFPQEVAVQGQGANAQGLYKLEAQTYPLTFKFAGLPSNTYVSVSINANQFQSNNGQPFVPGSPLGMLNLTFDQTNSRKAVHGGKSFGYYVQSDRNSETKIDLDLTVDRILNGASATQPVPQKITAVLGGPGGGYKVKVAEAELANQWGNNLSGAMFGDLTAGKYRVAFTGAKFDASDILTLNGTMAVSNLTIADGGPDPSSFKDNGTVTTTPPNVYTADMNVTTQPHTPAVPPQDLASKSVLEGMEMVRKEFHVRLPKGTQRGLRNNIDAGTIEACLGNTAEHWSDIMIHYYCQYGQARSCYTNTIRGKAQSIGNDQSLDTAAKIKKLSTIRLETWNECSSTAPNDDEWDWLVKNQGDVFQYIMNSQTFAFDDAQQQAVINKFYRINNPADKTECIEKRPRRAIDPKDGTHCLSGKQYNPPMKAAGR